MSTTTAMSAYERMNEIAHNIRREAYEEWNRLDGLYEDVQDEHERTTLYAQQRVQIGKRLAALELLEAIEQLAQDEAAADACSRCGVSPFAHKYDARAAHCPEGVGA